MHAQDLDIALATLDENPDARKAQMCREEARRLLQRQEISAETSSRILARLRDAARGARNGR
jgi:hypothetical protein